MTFSRCTNVGGEIEQRKRYWFDACKDADVIFYMITSEDLTNGRFGHETRIRDDFKWLASQMDQMKPHVSVHLLVNKIDTALEYGDRFKEFMNDLQSDIDSLEETARSVFGDFETKLTGISPTSMTDDHIFTLSFPRALENVYDSLHRT